MLSELNIIILQCLSKLRKTTRLSENHLLVEVLGLRESSHLLDRDKSGKFESKVSFSLILGNLSDRLHGKFEELLKLLVVVPIKAFDNIATYTTLGLMLKQINLIDKVRNRNTGGEDCASSIVNDSIDNLFAEKAIGHSHGAEGILDEKFTAHQLVNHKFLDKQES